MSSLGCGCDSCYGTRKAEREETVKQTLKLVGFMAGWLGLGVMIYLLGRLIA